MKNLSTNNQLGYLDLDIYTIRLLNYLEAHKDDEPFIMRQIDKDDKRYYLRQDENGYKVISFVNKHPIVCCEDTNSKGYERFYYKGKMVSKSRLIYSLFGENPYNLNLDELEIHHKNLIKNDNRLENLYPISPKNHHILHKYIELYGKENVEI